MVLSVILKGNAENMGKREWRYSGTIEERTSIREQVHDVLARKVAEEAMVLLKNESLLPLPLDVPMALFGSGAKKTVKGGIGSGGCQQPEDNFCLSGTAGSGRNDHK